MTKPRRVGKLGPRSSTDESDEKYILLNFRSGLTVDPRRCPKGIMTYPHWRLADGEHEPGAVNAVCKCPPETEAQPAVVVDAEADAA